MKPIAYAQCKSTTEVLLPACDTGSKMANMVLILQIRFDTFKCLVSYFFQFFVIFVFFRDFSSISRNFHNSTIFSIYHNFINRVSPLVKTAYCTCPTSQN